MRKKFINIFFVLSIFSVGVFAQSFPQPTGYVVDTVRVLDASSRVVMRSVSKQLDHAMGAQVVTVVVASTDGVSIEEYASKLYEKWGIGDKKEDKGVLLIAAINDKKVRIEVGYGLEGVITDGLSGQILDQVVLPSFKSGNIAEGLLKGHVVLTKQVATYYQVPLTISGMQTSNNREVRELTSVEQIMVLVVIFFLVIFGRRLGIWPLLFLIMASGRGGRSGFGGGGFGGFGGGMSGGGGSSRGW